MPFAYRILFVDDEARLREMAKAILESQGYEVLCAKDGFDGLSALKESLPDLVISDLQMPNMDGFEFLSVVRQRFPHLPVIVISGEFRGLDVPNSILADAFFEKSQYTARPTHCTGCRTGAGISTPSSSRKATRAGLDSHTEGKYVAVTCTNCLRTFTVSTPLASGIHDVPCRFCLSTVQFQLP